MKIIFWALIPSLFVMGIITFFSLVTIKNTALDVVKKRDVVLAEIAAKRLSENLEKYPLFLQDLANSEAFKAYDISEMNSIISRSKNWLHFFDGGIFYFDRSGKMNWSYPEQSFFTEKRFPDDKIFQSIKNSLRPSFSNILITEPSKEKYLIIGVPILSDDNAFDGVIVGIYSENHSAIGTTYSKVLEYESGRGSYAFLVDGKGNVLYHRHSSLIGTNIQSQDVVQNIIDGKTGAQVTYNSTGEMVISGFSPVPGTGWGIVTQGNWATIKDLIQFYSNLILVIIWSGGLVSVLVVFYFTQRLLEPVRELTEGTAQIAAGNFKEIPVKKTDDELETLSIQFNSMARAMKSSFAATQQRIDELDKARQALSRSEERISGIINAVDDIMLMVDDSDTIQWLNDKGRNVFGDDAVMRKYYEVLYQKPYVPEDCFIKAYFTYSIENDTEMIILAEGKYQHYWCTANAVHWGKQGEVNRVVVVFRNLTEKKQLRQEVLRNAQLAALGELAAGIAHEINNPINGIINYAQIIEDIWPLEDSPHTHLPERIIREGERIATIVSKLLSFARADTIQKQAVDIKKVIDDALDLIGVMLKKECIIVELEIENDIYECMAVAPQLLQIFLNILGNARYALNEKYSLSDPNKKIVINCENVVSEDTPMVRTTFKDYGTGIAKESLAMVCNPFFSTKPPDKGTGLGLSISYGIIEEHNGVLDVQSVYGDWTEVRIDLPVWRN